MSLEIRRAVIRARYPVLALCMGAALLSAFQYWRIQHRTETVRAEFSSLPSESPPRFGVSGNVQAVLREGDVLYVGGEFEYAGRVSAKLASFNKTTSAPSITMPDAIDDEIVAAISDGSGGWYIGGQFTSIGGVSRNRIAHITSDGSLDPDFDPDLDGPVVRGGLLLDGTTLYVSGFFSSVNGGTPRNNMAAFDTTSGLATSFDPDLDNAVYAMILNGTTLYIGGQFTTVNGGTTRNRIAALDATTGIATVFDPDVDTGNVYALALDGTLLYAGGNFTSVNGGTTRRRIAAFDTATGIATPFDPDLPGGGGGDEVFSLAFDDANDTLYAGGNFTSVNGGGTTRNGVAAFDTTTTGTATSFDPDLGAGDRAYSVLLDGTTLYVGGEFSVVNGGTIRLNAAAFDVATGTATAFDPAVLYGVSVVVDEGTNVAVFGNLALVNVEPRNNIAAFDLATGDVTSFDPNINGPVLDVILDDATLYVGGTFTDVNSGTTRNNLAAFDVGTGIATGFDPDADNSVLSILKDGSTLYAGGNFTSVNAGTNRNRLAAFDSASGVATSFNPGVNGTVNTMTLSGGTLYAGGSFTSAGHDLQSLVLVSGTSGEVASPSMPPVASGNVQSAVSDGVGGWFVGGDFSDIGGSGIDRLAHVLSDGSVDTAFDPDVDADVRIVLLDGSTLYAGGEFTSVNGGTTRNRLAAFDISNGSATPFDPDVDGSVLTLVLDGSTLYIGGSFTMVNGATTRNRLAAIDTGTGVATGFNPNVGSTSVYALLLDGSTLYAGGTFTTVNGATTRNRLAAFDTGTGTATAFNPNVSSTVFSLALDSATLYAGGLFTTVNGSVPRNYLAAFDTGTSSVTSFDPDVDSFVFGLFLDGATLYAGGLFTAVNGAEPRNYAAGFDTSTGTVTSFDPDLSAAVYVIQDAGTDKLFFGGEFSVPNMTTRNRIAAFDTSNSSLTSFDPDLDSTVNSIILDGATLFAAGTFTSVNGVTPRNYIAAFDTGTGIATSFNPDLDNNANALMLNGSTLYAGGEFNSVNGGTTRNYLAAFDSTTGTATDFDPNLDSTVQVLSAGSLIAGGAFASAGGAAQLSSLAIFDGVVIATPTPDEGSEQSGSFLSPEQLDQLFASPSPSPSSTPVFTPDPAGGVVLQDAALATTSRFVKVTYDNPFDDTVDVSIRTVNADALTPSDRELIYQQRYGKEVPASSPEQQPRNDGTLQLLDTTGNIELTSGAVRSFTPTISGWDLCDGAPTCPAGTYTVFAQFTKPTSGVLNVAGAIGDQVSDIYSDSIVYASATPTPTLTTTPALTPAVSGFPIPTPTPAVSGSPTPTFSAVVPAPSGAPIQSVSPTAPAFGVPTSAVSAAAFTAAVLSVIPILLSSLSLARNGLDGYYALAFALQSLMTATGLKRKPHLWGVVYDVGTKHGIPYAKMELVNEQGRVLETRFADRDGRYGFLSGSESVQQSKLVVRIRPTAAGYLFPSVRISLTSTDYMVYDQLYGGETLTIDPGTFITRNIPMDAQLWRSRHFSEFFPLLSIGASTSWLLNLAFWVGLVAVPWAYWNHPTILNLVMLIAFFSVNGFRWLSGLYRPFGTVRDSVTGKPVSYALVTLTDSAGIRATFSVTDEKGRYYLVAQQPGLYTVSAFTPANISPQRTATTQISVTKGWVAPTMKI